MRRLEEFGKPAIQSDAQDSREVRRLGVASGPQHVAAFRRSHEQVRNDSLADYDVPNVVSDGDHDARGFVSGNVR